MIKTGMPWKQGFAALRLVQRQPSSFTTRIPLRQDRSGFNIQSTRVLSSFISPPFVDNSTRVTGFKVTFTKDIREPLFRQRIAQINDIFASLDSDQQDREQISLTKPRIYATSHAELSARAYISRFAPQDSRHQKCLAQIRLLSDIKHIEPTGPPMLHGLPTPKGDPMPTRSATAAESQGPMMFAYILDGGITPDLPAKVELLELSVNEYFKTNKAKNPQPLQGSYVASILLNELQGDVNVTLVDGAIEKFGAVPPDGDEDAEVFQACHLAQCLEEIFQDIVKKGREGRAVVNISIVGRRPQVGASAAEFDQEQDLQDAVAMLESVGVLVFVAAGDSGMPASWFSPAWLSSVITVGAHDGTGRRCDFSNY